MSEQSSPFSFLTRRAVLKLGLAGGGALILGGSGGLMALRGSAPSVAGLSMVSDHGYRTLANLASTHIPQGGAFAEGAADFDLARLFDGFLAGESTENVVKLKRAIHLIEYGPLLFDGRLATFSNLNDAEKAAHWESWMLSDQLVRRQVATAFRKFFSLVFYDQPAVWTHIGYEGPAFMENDQ